MSEHQESKKEKHPTTNWFKLFSGLFCVIYIFLVWQVISCPSGTTGDDFTDFLRGASCVVYGMLVFFSILIGLLPVFLGLEHTRKKHIPNSYFKIILAVYIVGLLAVIFF